MERKIKKLWRLIINLDYSQVEIAVDGVVRSEATWQSHVFGDKE